MAKTGKPTDYKAFGNLLRKVRKEAGFTQVTFAKRLRQPQTFVSQCELGNRRVDVIELRRFCRILGISLTEFVGRFEKAARKGK